MSFEEWGYRLDCWIARAKRLFIRKKPFQHTGAMADLVQATLKAHQQEIIDNMASNNILLERLKRRKPQ